MKPQDQIVKIPLSETRLSGFSSSFSLVTLVFVAFCIVVGWLLSAVSPVLLVVGLLPATGALYAAVIAARIFRTRGYVIADAESVTINSPIFASDLIVDRRSVLSIRSDRSVASIFTTDLSSGIDLNSPDVACLYLGVNVGFRCEILLSADIELPEVKRVVNIIGLLLQPGPRGHHLPRAGRSYSCVSLKLATRSPTIDTT